MSDATATAALEPQPQPESAAPVFRGAPVVGHLFSFLRDPMGLLLRGYRAHGPIFQVSVPGQRFTVLAGPEANVFAGRQALQLFRSAEFWGGYARTVGSERFLPALDGPAHFRLRKIMQRGYSKGTIIRHFGDVVNITRDVLSEFDPGQTVSVVYLMRRIITQQLGLLMAGRAPGPYFEDFVRFVRTTLNVTVLKRWPGLLLRTPGFKRSKARVFEFGEQLIADRRAARTRGAEPDLLDDLIAAADDESNEINHTELLIEAVGPFIAGLDTAANTCAFMLYALLTNPQAMARVSAEVDGLFASGPPTPEGMAKLPDLHGAAMETLRLYPTAPMLGRTAVRSFSYGGHSVQEGEPVLIATTLPHHLPELYPEPERFDIDRFRAPREEHLQKGAFAPFGFGPHTCLGGGLAEIQIALTLATVLRSVRVELPRGYKLRIKQDPTPTPGPALKVRIVERRKLY